MFLQPLDLTTALRPLLLPDETLLFVQDSVGLYKGKYKIPSLQNGHAYLTSHRACYVDKLEPRKGSIAIDLKSVEKYEFYAGFLKSSSKITFYPKAAKRSSVQNWSQPGAPNPQLGAYTTSRSSTSSPIPQGIGSGASTPRSSNVTWICTICSFSNPVPTNFDAATANANTPLPPCLACGIKPSLTHMLKAAISSASGRQASPAPSAAFQSSTQVPPQPLIESHGQFTDGSMNEYYEAQISNPPSAVQQSKFQCVRCTFLNHPSLLSCELCGAPLISSETLDAKGSEQNPMRPESPGPSLDGVDQSLENSTECIKFSFRAGGEKIFHERLKGAMVQRKWLLQNAPPVPPPNHLSDSAPLNRLVPNGQEGQTLSERPKVVGIAGLESRGKELRKNNERVIGTAFSDLEALMASAKEIIALAESFAAGNKSLDSSTEENRLLLESATALSMVTTKSMLSSSGNSSSSLYLSELSRNVAEYLTDDTKGILRKEGGIMSLTDLWAMFNRARGGVELISPNDLEKASHLWESLQLPVRLRQFKNGLLVVQRHDRTDDKTITQILAWLKEFHEQAPEREVLWDWKVFGRGVTAMEAATRFGWSVGVAVEELEMAEERGALWREEGVEGVRWWENCLGMWEGGDVECE